MRLLGGFTLSDARSGTVVLPATAQRVLAYLALERRPVKRTSLAARVWPAGTDSNAQSCLRSAIWRIRSSGLSLAIVNRLEIELAESVYVDVTQQVRVATRRLETPEVDPIPGERLLLQDDLLPDWYDDWVSLERARLRQLRLHALEALSRALSLRNRHGESVEAAYVAVAADPLRESAQRALIAAFLAEGNRADASRQYVAYRELARRRLGADVSPELRALIES